jgi:hypothetical protein
VPPSLIARADNVIENDLFAAVHESAVVQVSRTPG